MNSRARNSAMKSRRSIGASPRCFQAEASRALTESPPAFSTWGWRSCRSAPPIRNEPTSTNRAVGAPTAATRAPPSAGPRTKVVEKPRFRAALALRSRLGGSRLQLALGDPDIARRALGGDPVPRCAGDLRTEQCAGGQGRGAVQGHEREDDRKREVGEHHGEAGCHERLEQVEPAQLAASLGCLDAGHEGGDDQRG